MKKYLDQKYPVLWFIPVILFLLSLFLILDANAQTSETRDTYNEFSTSTQGYSLSETGSGSAHSFTYSGGQGNPQGSIQSTCTNTTGGCVSNGLMTLSGTWHSLFSIPENAIVTGVLSGSYDHIENTLGQRVYSIGDILFGNSQACSVWCFVVHNQTTHGSTVWETVGFNAVPNTDMLVFSDHAKGTDTLKLFIPISTQVNPTMIGGTATQRFDNLRMQIGYFMPPPFYLPWLPTAVASSTCQFSLGNTTSTVICDDPAIISPTHDLANVFFLFFIVFFGILFYMRKGGEKQ